MAPPKWFLGGAKLSYGPPQLDRKLFVCSGKFLCFLENDTSWSFLEIQIEKSSRLRRNWMPIFSLNLPKYVQFSPIEQFSVYYWINLSILLKICVSGFIWTHDSWMAFSCSISHSPNWSLLGFQFLKGVSHQESDSAKKRRRVILTRLWLGYAFVTCTMTKQSK